MTTAHIASNALTHLFDDAAIFPPGDMPLALAVTAHLEHVAGPRSELVGPFIVKAADLEDLKTLTAGLAPGSLDLAIAVPSPALAGEALAAARAVPAVRVVALEVAVPLDIPVSVVVPILALTTSTDFDGTIFVEVPRDGRRDELLDELVNSPYLAKFRTGGVTAEAYPDEGELAAAIGACVRRGLPFKATAGLHHAVRNTDLSTGFEQHGFLNLLAATEAALQGADDARLAELLSDRSNQRVSAMASAVSDSARVMFRSFGTCSIDEPADDLVDLGLLEVVHIEEIS